MPATKTETARTSIFPQKINTKPFSPGNFGAFKAVAVGSGASRLSAELASGYREAGGGGMGLAEAVRLAARVLEGERKREQAALDRDAGGGSGSKFRGIGMEIATVAVEDGTRKEASAYIYNDFEVEKVLGSLGKENGGRGVEEGIEGGSKAASEGGTGDSGSSAD